MYIHVIVATPEILKKKKKKKKRWGKKNCIEASKKGE